MVHDTIPIIPTFLSIYKPIMINFKEKLLFSSVLLLALCMRIHFMTRSLFYDELYTAVHGAQASSLFDALFKNYSPSNHLGYTAVAYFTCHLLGTREWALRLPALLFGLGSIFVFWKWSRKYFGSQTAILGSFFLALAPAHIIWSASARGYSACVFFTLLSTSLYFSLLEKPSLKTTLLLTLTNIFAPSFHVYFLCVFLAQFLHFLLISIRFSAKQEPSMTGRSLFFILLSIGATILCSVLIYFQTLPTLAGMAADHRAFVPGFPVTLLNDFLSLPLCPLGLLCLGLMVIGFISPNVRLAHWRVYVALLFLMVLPVWFSKPVYIYPRFFAYLLPFFFLLIAHGMVHIVKNSPLRMRVFILTMTVLVLGFISWTWITRPSKIVEDFHYKFRESVEFAEKASGANTRFCAFGNEDDFFQFYAHRPVVTFKTFEDFKTFFDEHNQIICFNMMGLPMPDEHKKIFLYLYTLKNVKAKDFDNIIVFDLKD